MNRQNPLNRQYLLNKISPCHCTGWLNRLCHTSKPTFFLNKKCGKQLSGNRRLIFWEGKKCWETGVWFFGEETGVGKQVSGYDSRKQVSGNRCLDSCWKQVSGNRCLDSSWKQVSGIRCLEINCLETDVFSHSGNLCHWDLPVQSRRETMVLGINGLKTSVGIQVSG